MHIVRWYLVSLFGAARHWERVSEMRLHLSLRLDWKPLPKIPLQSTVLKAKARNTSPTSIGQHEQEMAA